MENVEEMYMYDYKCKLCSICGVQNQKLLVLQSRK